MGFPPSAAREMSMWQYMAALDGWISANSVDGDKQISAEEADDLWGWIEDL
jgi:hypothetical protein